jgi:ribosomal protein L16 Arg81 hydroxylase
MADKKATKHLGKHTEKMDDMEIDREFKKDEETKEQDIFEKNTTYQEEEVEETIQTNSKAIRDSKLKEIEANKDQMSNIDKGYAQTVTIDVFVTNPVILKSLDII